jgi:hypothetical protein
MMTARTGDRDLEAWLTAVEADDGQPELRSFATGIRHDQQAVTNGLTLAYSSGKVEGTVNKIKMLKRQMYGRRIQPAPHPRHPSPSVTTEFASEPSLATAVRWARLREFDGGGAARGAAPAAGAVAGPLASWAGDRCHPDGEHDTGVVGCVNLHFRVTRSG